MKFQYLSFDLTNAVPGWLESRKSTIEAVPLSRPKTPHSTVSPLTFVARLVSHRPSPADLYEAENDRGPGKHCHPRCEIGQLTDPWQPELMTPKEAYDPE
jgi:hypothetical protein